MAHAGLGGQMDDAVDVAMPVGQRQHGFAVGNVGLEEGEALVLAQRLQAGELQDRVVVGAEIVDADHRLAARQQGAGDVAADEAGGAGDEDGHGIGLRLEIRCRIIKARARLQRFVPGRNLETAGAPGSRRPVH